MDVFKIPEESGPALRLNPLKTDKVAFNVYDFRPWQALSMHRHPGCDEVFYVIEGGCLFYVESERRKIEPGQAVYVRAGSSHAVLSCGKKAVLISVIGPRPVASVYERLEYFCPACQLETPLAVGTRTGSVVECPRCKKAIKLMEAGDAFAAEIVERGAPSEARA